MAFTTTLPTSPGYYWIKNDNSPNPTIVQVFQQSAGNGTGNITGYLYVGGWALDGTEQWEGPLAPA